jgi:signal transduction histidine kinase/ActR/RegA family two-component response regulator
MMRRMGYLSRCLVISIFSLVVAVAISLSPLGRAMDAEVGDRLAALVAPDADFSEVVVVDVDEASMASLAKQIGSWPYDRDIYALVNRYLLQAGASAVVFDILFSEARRGDEEFAATLGAKNVLAAASLPSTGAGRDAMYQAQLGRAAWAHGSGWPARSWDDLTLPIEKFTDRAQVGVISVGADPDGLLRRIPLLHHVHGEVIPSLAPAAMKAAGMAIELNQATRRVKMAGQDLPTDDDGMLALRFPKNWQLRVVPFYEVALAASGSVKYQAMAETLRAKMVYIGSSSAILGDFAHTPAGRLPGLYLAAATPTMLKTGLLFRPRHWALDGALTLVVLMLVVGAAHPRAQRMNWLQILMFPGLVLVSTGFVLLSNFEGQKIAVFLPVLAGILAHVGALVWRQLHLFRQNQKLQVEKLAAEQSNRLKGQFLSHMTHELRTPLTAILGFNNINWKSDDLGRTERVNNSAVIDRNGRHLLALINGILDQAKLEAGQVRIVTQPDSLRVLVKDVLDTMRPLGKEKSLTLAASFAPDTPEFVEMDAFRMRQILLNLVGNAVKFTETGGVEVAVGWSGGMLSLEVIDTGPGLTDSQQARLFVAFQQGSESVSVKHGGTGLGLAICRDLVTLMNGTIGVSSKLGGGARFLVRIPAPIAQPPANLAAPPTMSEFQKLSEHVAHTAASPVQGMHGVVLVVEDANDLRRLVGIYLKRLGLTVLEAVDGAQAVDLALRERPDAILMDMEIPVMHGLDAVKALRAQGFSRPILAMTAHLGEEQRTLALAAGCNDLLTKPVSFTTLQLALDGALGGRAHATV